MPKYTKTNKEELLQERREHPENFRGLNIKIKHIENLIKVWSTRKRKKSEEATLDDMK